MPELDDAAFERRLRGVLKEHLGALPLDLTVDALDRRREANGVAPRFGRGRGMTLLAAAALLLVGGALAAGSGLLRVPSVVPPVPEPSVIAVATASPDATFPSPSESAAPSASPIPVAGPGGVWIPTGTMGTPRDTHTAVRLLDGRVLVVGENDISAELYDPLSGTWSATGNMLKPAAGFSATLLGNGKVLVGDVEDREADDSITGAEVYDPASGTWTATGTMVKGADFVGDKATLLRDGKVLVAGLNGVQLYDPASGTWSATEKMTTPRYHHTATLLPDGRVLVAGGDVNPDRATDAAELYDPATGSWTATADLHATGNAQSDVITATLLQDGTVLVVRPSTAELYDPGTGTWNAMEEQPRASAAYRKATLLLDGMVLVTGDMSDATLYDPRARTWATAAPMLRSHGRETPPILLLDGTVLVAGGRDCLDGGVCVATGSAELYVPAGVSLPPFDFPSPTPIEFPSPTPRPTPLAPAAGPVPPNARSWKVTVDNRSSEPATLFVAEEDGGGLRLVGSATPNVVPAGATVKVTFLFPAKGGPDGWIYVNPRPGEGGSLVHAADIGIPGKIVISSEGDGGWLSP